MKMYAKVVQSDERGQIVIPKDIRLELKLERGAAFALYVIENEGIFLKPVEVKELGETAGLAELKKHADKLKLNKKNIDKSIHNYRKLSASNLREVR